ncbi:Diguanylate cyclase with hemerythrin-like metal-binding domain-containing protein [Magnetospirillum sp. SS-4]|nr:diguanylate cyclase [Magnetospirillum sp. SS-4]CAA7625074.1 Diguanylate cyclase with hemerythrin-like metal-binding domain-containing protein [Magnetospirillum sp. SS-4]
MAKKIAKHGSKGGDHTGKARSESEELLHTIFECAGDPVLLLCNGNFIDCNTAALKLLGYASKADLLDRRPSDISPPHQPDGLASPDKAAEMIDRAIENGYHRFEWVHLRADGSTIPVDVMLTSITVGERLYLHTLWRDLTERKQVEETLRNRETLIRTIYDTSSVAIFFINATGRICHANRRMAEMFRLSMDRLIGADYVSLVHPAERDDARQNMHRHLSRDIADVNLVRRYWREDGTEFWGQLTANRMLDNPRDGAGLVCVVMDISERKAAEEALVERSRELETLNQELAAANTRLASVQQELERLAMRDTLTGAWNRRYLSEIAQQEILRLDRYGHPVSVIFIDLDHFKAINDSHGHAVGDIVIQGFCDIARRCMRITDMLGRWGGEEFVIIMPNSGLMIASLLAERIRAAMAAHSFPQAGGVTASFGVAECRRDESWETWLERADAALYAAKKAGRNRVVSDTSDRNDAAQAESLDSSFLRLVWHNAYECGLSHIDNQHRSLFEHADSLLGAVMGDRPKDEIIPQINTLLNDLLVHFADEEAILRAAGYMELEQHAEIHRGLSEQAIEMARKFTDGELNIGDLFNFIAHDIVGKHLLSDDRKYFHALSTTET